MSAKVWERLIPAPTAYDWSEATREIHAGAIHLVGFEFDGTACFRKGTVNGPNALRDIMYGIEGYSPYLDRDLDAVATFYDMGNLPVGQSDDIDGNWQQATDYFLDILGSVDIAATKTTFLTLGGEHSISYAPIKAYLEAYPDLVLLHLDAHADLRDGYEGHHYSHASIIRRASDHFGPKHSLIQYGIRSGTKEEYDWMKEHQSVRTSLESFLQSVRDIPADRPVYLTLDLDYFDPSFFPGTGTPEPGGETFHSFVALMKILSNKNFVGADVVELSPDIDPTGNSSVFAAKVVREVILCLSEKK